MKKRIVKFFSFVMGIFLTFGIIFSIAAVAFAIAGNYFPNISPTSFIYLLFGEAIMPIEQIVNGGIGLFSSGMFTIIIIALAVVILIVSILGLKFFAKAGRGKNGVKIGALVPSIFICLILAGFYSFSAVISILNMDPFNAFLAARIVGPVEIVFEYLGYGFITLKSIVFSCAMAGLSILNLMVLIACRERRKKSPIFMADMTFYSDEYLKKSNENQMLVKESGEAQVEDLPMQQKSPAKQKLSQDLIDKIRQLSLLKNEGKITEVEYTKLRQKAIRKYRG